MLFLKFATSAPEAMLEAARNFRQTAFHRISCVDNHSKLRNELNARIAFIVSVMRLSIQPILWNAI